MTKEGDRFQRKIAGSFGLFVKGAEGYDKNKCHKD